MEKKNNGLIIIIIILSLLVISLGGFIIYDKISTNKSDENTSNSEKVNVQDKKTNNDYKLFANNLKSKFSKYDNNNKNYLYVNNGIVKDGYEVYLNEKQTLFVKYFNEEFNSKYGEYKIADNVLSFYVIAIGQGGGNMLYFINEDGTVGSANIEYEIGNNNQIEIKKDLGYKNIVSIVNGVFGDEISGTHSPIFIDINGNVFSDNFR